MIPGTKELSEKVGGKLLFDRGFKEHNSEKLREISLEISEISLSSYMGYDEKKKKIHAILSEKSREEYSSYRYVATSKMFADMGHKYRETTDSEDSGEG